MNPSGRGRKLADVCRSLATGGEGDADQSAVWDGVQGVLRSLGIESQTQALSDAYAPRREAIEAFVQGIAVVPFDRRSSVVLNSYCLYCNPPLSTRLSLSS